MFVNYFFVDYLFSCLKNNCIALIYLEFLILFSYVFFFFVIHASPVIFVQ